jgi:hypothetical protein
MAVAHGGGMRWRGLLRRLHKMYGLGRGVGLGAVIPAALFV